MKKKKTGEQIQKMVFGLPARWEREKMFKNLWNKEDGRIFPPKYFGIGWDVNFHALLKKAGLIKSVHGPE